MNPLCFTGWLIRSLMAVVLSHQSRLVCLPKKFYFRAGVYILRDWRVALEFFRVCKD